MVTRLAYSVALVALLLTPLVAKDKKKSPLPEYVLRARTVRVVIQPDAGEPLEQPTANATARDNVEKALMAWGRLQPMIEGQEADLVIAVRIGTGKLMQPTVKGGPIDRRGGVIQSTDSTIHIGAQTGHPPLDDPTMDPRNSGPHISNQVGPTEDSFEVYQGNTGYSLDSSPVWRYVAKNCLRAPTVTAVEEFRKAITEAEKLQQKKP